MPTVSVIIPAYNQGHYLTEAINSVLDQTYQDYEVVLIDDGSEDNTSTVAKNFSNSRFHYIHQENHGLSSARNVGLHNILGPLVTFLDADDKFLPEKLALLVPILEKQPNIGLIAGKAIFIDENSRLLNKMINTRLPDDPTLLLFGNPIHVGSILVRRTWLDKVGLFDESLQACEDWDMWLRLAMAGCQLSSIEQSVSLYRVHYKQMTRGAKRMREAMFTVLDKTFSSPSLPENWRCMCNKAYSSAYIKAAARAYHAGEFTDAKNDLTEAVKLDPYLLDEDARYLADQLAGWADSPMSEDPLKYLEKVYDNLPDCLLLLRKFRYKHLAQKALQLTYESYMKDNLNASRFYLLRALYYQPNKLFNRGILSILIRSCFNFSMMKNMIFLQ